MAKQKTPKEEDAIIQRYIENRTYVKLFRKICGEEEDLSGFILKKSKNFLLLQLAGDFTMEGYAIIRIGDYERMRNSSYDRTQKKILKAEGIFDATYGIQIDIPLTTWGDILTTLKKHDQHVIIENFRKDYLDFLIGRIMRVTNKSISIHNYDPDGILDAKPTLIKLETVNIIKFGDRYSTVFRKYLIKK